jgi:hypothetical protein
VWSQFLHEIVESVVVAVLVRVSVEDATFALLYAIVSRLGVSRLD